MKGLGNIGVRDDKFEAVFSCESFCMIEQPEVLLSGVHVAGVVDAQVGDGLAWIRRCHVVLDAIKCVYATGARSSDPTGVRQGCFGQRGGDFGFVQNGAVVREGRDEVGAELVEELGGDGGLTDDVLPVTHGVEQEADEEGVGTFVVEALGVFLVKFNLQGTSIVSSNEDVRE